jgi:hypothetical protein
LGKRGVEREERGLVKGVKGRQGRKEEAGRIAGGEGGK